jgi:Chalcone isomerase-like
MPPILRTALALSAASFFLVPPITAQAASLEGVTVDETVVVNGQKLVLNGMAVRKRGYFKTEVSALYLPQRTDNPEVVYRTNAMRYVRMTILRDLPSATASRFFIKEFTQNATEAEAKQLINELGTLGGIYGSLNKINKGDVVEIIWTPGPGMTARYNGKLITEQGVPNPLWWAVYMRGYVGPNVSDAYRAGLMGASLGN